MISIYKNSSVLSTENGEAKSIEIRGLSTDTKPTTYNGKGINNGAMFIEMDTKKIYLYDLENETWREM